MGCGRVGSALCIALATEGHSVAVVDQDPAAFRRLPEDFPGLRVTGVGFDRDTLIEAGITRADAFAAVSSGDNSNIISARVARETFAVPRVVARIYDPRRAEVYQRLGIPTVATVRWTAEQIVYRLLPERSAIEWVDPSGRIELLTVEPHPSWVGRALRDLEVATGVRIGFLTRLGEAEVPLVGTRLQEGDLLHLVVARDHREHAQATLRAVAPAVRS